MDYQLIIDQQRRYFDSGATLPIENRLANLEKLRQGIIEMEQEILDALHQDLGKSSFEGYMTEIGMVLDDLRFAIKNLPKWAKPRKAHTPMAQFPSKSYIYPEPYGIALIMAPWNYPFQLCIEPLIGVIAAGNCAIIKPSAYAKACSNIIDKLVSRILPPQLATVIQGGREVNSILLEQKFDYIFFTGSIEVGKLVMRAAAQHLTPVSLELGGKSPCIIEKTANIDIAAKRISFGKYLNAGQTCVAPDYVLADNTVINNFIERMTYWLKTFFPTGALNDNNYPKIINEKHFSRLINLLNQGKITIGGNYDQNSLKIEPTIITDISFDDEIMQDEIFGPLLPVIGYDNLADTLSQIKNQAKPLSCYLFTENENIKRQVLKKLSFGGGCINDTIIHLATPHMGFGGVGESGMGNYHGKNSFDTFTHYKSIVDKSTKIDLPMRYHPYSEKNLSIIKKFLK